MNDKLLILCLNWPEPASTAAGSRMMQLIEVFKDGGYTIHIACAARTTDRSTRLDPSVVKHNIALNDDAVDTWLQELNPKVVLYDRFIIEEQYGWRVRDVLPGALQVLDTEDLHFLRYARRQAVIKDLVWDDTMLINEITLREAASIYRCDLSLIIADYEVKLLKEKLNIPATKLFYIPFLVREHKITNLDELPGFKERQHLLHIGNFKHAPNVDAVIQLHTKLWPQIRKQLPDVQLHIYGPYAPQHIVERHDPINGFYIMGAAQDAIETMKKYRLNLAPLRYGAGLKGKLLDALLSGTPSVMTPLAAQGMYEEYDTPGAITYSEEEFVNQVVSLCNNQDRWQETRLSMNRILRNVYGYDAFAKALNHKLTTLNQSLEIHRKTDLIGSILKAEVNNSNRFKSRWIIEKNNKT